MVAYLSLHQDERPAHLFVHGCQCATIDQVCVTEGRRGQGIFRALLNEARNVARAWGMSRLELGVWADNTTARNAFIRCGFQTYYEKMRLPVDDQVDD
jgi:GNAT superfamily N-acetyltransferase